MKITCDKSDLVQGLQIIRSAMSNRTTLPALMNFLAETEGGKLKLISTDLELGAKFLLPVEIDTEGAIAIPARKFSEIIDNVDGDVAIEIKDGKVIVKSGKSRFQLIVIPKDQYPILPDFDINKAINLPTSILADMVSKAIVAVSDDDSRRVLQGALWTAEKGTLTIVATDGRQLSVVTREFPDASFNVIVPRKVMQEFVRLAPTGDDVFLVVTDSIIAFQFNNTTLHSKLIEGSFPKWDQVVPSKSDLQVTFDTKALVGITKRASLAAMDHGSIKWKLANGALIVTASSPNVDFEDEIPVEYTGDEFAIAFNPEFVLTCLGSFKSEKVTVGFTSNNNPILFQPVGDKDHKYVIMPMRA